MQVPKNPFLGVAMLSSPQLWKHLSHCCWIRASHPWTGPCLLLDLSISRIGLSFYRPLAESAYKTNTISFLTTHQQYS